MTVSKRLCRITINGLDYELVYILKESSNSYICYDIAVKMVNLNDGMSNERIVRDVTTDRNTATSIFERIVAGLATPLSLKYIIEDILCE